MQDKLHIVIVQPDIIWKNIPANLMHYEKMLSGIADAHIIILPEMFATGFISDPQSLSNGQQVVLDWMLKVSAEKRSLIIGSHPWQENQVFYNRLFAVQPGGDLIHYDKRHLFAYGGERENFKPGTGRIFVETVGWKILPLICYDLRFPVWSRNTVKYDLLVYIANWPASRQHIWELLMRARAVENQCVAIGINRTGTDGRGIEYKGGSMIASPDGTILASLNENEGILEFILDPAVITNYRRKFPFLEDRDAFRFE